MLFAWFALREETVGCLFFLKSGFFLFLTSRFSYREYHYIRLYSRFTYSNEEYEEGEEAKASLYSPELFEIHLDRICPYLRHSERK